MLQLIRDRFLQQDDSVIICNGNDAAIKQPVKGAGESESIACRIRAVMFCAHWADVGCFDLGSAPSIDQLQPCHGAGKVVR